MVQQLPAVEAGRGIDRAFRSVDRALAGRLAPAALGLACLAPALAWRGEANVADAALAASLSLALAGAVLADAGRTVVGSLCGGAARGGLLAAALVATGPAAWPLVLLLAAEPVQVLAAKRRSDAWGSALGSAAGLSLGLVALGSTHVASPVATGIFAAALLICLVMASSLAPWTSRAQPKPEVRSPESDDGLLAAACDLVTWHDANGDVIRANSTAARLAGAPPRALRGGGLLARVHVPDRPAYLKALSDAANGGGPVTVEFRLHAAHDERGQECDRSEAGRVVWVEMRAYRLTSGDADATGARVVALTRDNSAQRRHAEELERARREAEKANEMKGRFLATVSHELRTPLNAIIGFSELLAVDHPYVVTEDRRKEYASIIRGSGHHLLAIVNTLLDMSKIETGNFPFEPEPFSLHELAASCCDLMQLKADEAGLRLARALDADGPPIVADRRACRQILINLLSNAVKFTPKGGTVTVSLARSGGSLVLAVSDTGIGIAETDLPRLGDAFFQAGDVHQRPYEGTGLGLSVVRGLVGLHGGELAIESGAGEGTTVTVTLPLAAGRAVASPHPAAVHAFPRRPLAVRERKTA